MKIKQNRTRTQEHKYDAFIKWAAREFRYPIPPEYLAFLQKGDFATTTRMFYAIDLEAEIFLEVSEWFACADTPFIYENCCEEKIIEKHHLPILDSCACTVVIDCNPNGKTYGYVFICDPASEVNEGTEDPIVRPMYVASNFLELLKGLHSADDLERLTL